MKVQYILSWFAAESDTLIGEEVLADVTAKQIAEWFFLPAGHPCQDSYVVTASQRIHLAKITEHEIDLNRFNYFVDGYALND